MLADETVDGTRLTSVKCPYNGISCPKPPKTRISAVLSTKTSSHQLTCFDTRCRAACIR